MPLRAPWAARPELAPVGARPRRLTRLRWDDEREQLEIKGDALESSITGLTRVVR